jgi:hypothetical protein
MTAAAGIAFAAMPAPPDNLDPYGCRIEPTGKYHCYTGNAAGQVFNSQQEMFSQSDAAVLNNSNVIPPASVNGGPSLNNNAIPPANVNGNPSLNNNALPIQNINATNPPLSTLIPGNGQNTRKPVGNALQK